MSRQSVWLARGARGGRPVLACGLLLVAATVASADPLRIRTDYGPSNADRPMRAETRYIVLHTTEGREAGSLRKLRRLGEAHYFVHRDGRVARLIDRHRIATHAGLSMWAGRRDLDEVSLGIEVSGYHDKEPTPAQRAAIRELLRQLQSVYEIPDDRVLTHSMVAYGAPNRFHRHAHRGRKRCGMVFADPAVRARLGLTAAPRRDPDVTAGRLRAADRELQRRLYPQPVRQARAEPARAAPAPAAPAAANVVTRHRTPWRIAGTAHARPSTVYVFPDGSRVRGDAVKDWGDIPRGTRVLLEQAPAGVARGRGPEPRGAPVQEASLDVDGLLLVSHPAAARDLLGGAAASDTTTYIFPSGSVRSGAELERGPDGPELLRRLPAGTRVLVGYVNAGRLGRGRSPTQVAGSRWNHPRTYYRTPSGSLRSGPEIDHRRFTPGTLVFLRP